MYIKNRSLTIVSKLIIAVLSFSVVCYLFGAFGWDALRLFPSWVLIISAVYFLGTAVFLLLGRKRVPGKNPCPMCEGMIICGFLLMTGMAIASACGQFYLPKLDYWVIWLICDILPLLVLIDWALFVKKGRFRPMHPFYWLALPVCYAAVMLFTAEFLSERTALRYPLVELNYLAYGVWPMFTWMLLIGVCVLIGGYTLYLLDFAMSGKLAKNIVLPHIVTIEEDEYGRVIDPIPGNRATATAKTTTTTSTTEDEKATGEILMSKDSTGKTTSKVKVKATVVKNNKTKQKTKSSTKKAGADKTTSPASDKTTETKSSEDNTNNPKSKNKSRPKITKF